MKRLMLGSLLFAMSLNGLAQSPAPRRPEQSRGPALSKVEGWPQWRGPARDGVASTFTVPTAWPAQLTKRWQAAVGLGHASPVISGNRVVVHARQGNREIVSAYDLQSGKQLWQDGVDAPYTMNSAATGHGPGPKSTPAIADGRVFTLGISGIFSAHDLATGKLLWRKNAPPAPPEFGTATSPLVDGSNVIAFLGGTGGGALTASDAASGAVKWRWAGDGPSYASPVIATLGGTRQVITQSQNKLVGIDAAGGQLLWEVALKTPYEQNSVTPLVMGDLVIYAGLENPTIALTRYQNRRQVDDRAGVAERASGDVHEHPGSRGHRALRAVEQEPRPVLRDRRRLGQDAVDIARARCRERLDRARG